jgi:hypothetical protein
MSYVVIGTGLCFLGLRLATFIIPELVCIALSFVLAIALLAVLVISAKQIIFKGKNIPRTWHASAVLSLLFLVGGFEFGPWLGRNLADWIFKKHRVSYAGVVNQFKSGQLPCVSSCNGKLDSVEAKALPGGVRDLLAGHCNDGGVIVLFRAKIDVPLIHEGYFYKDYGQASNCGLSFVSPETGWPHTPYVRHVEGYWYHFSDQPGL